MGTLYIVATPLGNREDITLRAVKILTSVDVIITEDILKTSNLLSYLASTYPSLITPTDLAKRVTFLKMNDFSETNSIHEVLSALGYEKNVALVSEAGTPLISDPGYKVVREALKRGVKVVSIPGPSAPISALVSSGLPSDKFYFLGFLPKSFAHKEKEFKNIVEILKVTDTAKLTPTIIFFESSHRIIETFEVMKHVFGDIEIVVAREMTKVYEEVNRRTLSEHIERYSKESPKGEFTVLFSTKS